MASDPFLLTVVWGSVLVVGASAVLAWRHRPRPGATPFTVAMLAATWWVTTSAIGLFTTDPALRLFWAKVGWAGAAGFPVAWVAFALAYTGRSRWLELPRITVLGAIPAVTLGLALTNGVGHRLVYRSTSFAAFGSVSILYRSFGPWFWVHTAYAVGLMLVGAAMIVSLTTHRRPLYRGQATALLLVVAPPMFGTLVYTTGLSPVEGFDPTPFTFVISGAAGLAALSGFAFLDAVPVTSRVAHRSVVDELDAGVIVADATGAVVEANRRADELLGDGASLVGEQVTKLLPKHGSSVDEPGMRDRPNTTEEAETDRVAQVLASDEGGEETTVVTVEAHGRERYYEINVTALTDAYENVTGRVYLVRDVTGRRRRLQRLNVLNRVLRHNLRNEMTVLYGYADALEQGGDPETLADDIRSKAADLVQLSEKAREIDRVLDDSGQVTTDLTRVVEVECDRLADEFPAVAISRQTPDRAVRVHEAAGTVVCNLLENALVHNNSTDQWVSVDLTVADERATVTVKDNGPGIPDGERAALAADAETQLEHAGGLGLWIASWGVATVGGSLEVADREEGGTRATVTVPLVAESDQSEQSTDEG